MKNFKNLTCILVLFFLPIAIFSQLKNSAQIIISDSWVLKTIHYSHQTGGNINLDGTLSVSGDWQNSSGSPDVFTIPSNGYVLFEGTGTQTVSQTTNFNNVELNNAIVLTGTMNIEGIIKLNDKEISGTGNFYLLAGATGATSHADGFNGNLINTGTVSLHTAANYKYYGGNTQETGSLLPATINNLIVDKTANDVTLSRTGLSEINGTLEITAGSLIANSQAHISVNGNTNIGSAQGLILSSDINSTASFIDNSHISGSGTVKVENYLKYMAPVNDFGRYLSMPISNAHTDMFDNPAAGIFYFNSTIADWALINNSSLDVMTGYVTRYPAEKTLAFVGSLNTGLVERSDLIRTTTPNNNFGWNLVGNPYPSALDWDEVIEANGGASGFVNTTKLNNAIYFRPADGGSCHTYVGGIGNPGGTTGIIPPMQSFWVQVTQGESLGSLSFNNAARVHSTTPLYKKSTLPLIRLRGNNGLHNDETVVVFSNLATSNFDTKYDAVKVFAQNNNFPELFSFSENNYELSINALDFDNTHLIVPLGYISLIYGAHNIEAFDFDNIDPNVSIHLEDKKLNVMHDLRQQTIYNFTHTDTDTPQRFDLHFVHTNTSDEMVLTAKNSEIEIHAYENVIYINFNNNNTENFNVQVFDIIGKNVYSESGLGFAQMHKIEMQVPNGVYMVKVFDNNQNITKKIILKK